MFFFNRIKAAVFIMNAFLTIQRLLFLTLMFFNGTKAAVFVVNAFLTIQRLLFLSYSRRFFKWNKGCCSYRECFFNDTKAVVLIVFENVF